MKLEPYLPPKTTPSPVPGTRTLQLEATSLHEVVQQIQQGLPYEAFTRLLAALDVTLVKFSQEVGLSTTTLNRRKNQPLTVQESDLVYRYARLFEEATHLLGAEERARRWLKEPSLALGGETPLKYAHTELGGQLVESLILALEDGVVV